MMSDFSISGYDSKHNQKRIARLLTNPINVYSIWARFNTFLEFTTLLIFFSRERLLVNFPKKTQYFNEKKSRETRHPKMSLMARRWEVGALHQMQGMSQSAIFRKTGYHHRFVKNG